MDNLKNYQDQPYQQYIISQMELEMDLLISNYKNFITDSQLK